MAQIMKRGNDIVTKIDETTFKNIAPTLPQGKMGFFSVDEVDKTYGFVTQNGSVITYDLSTHKNVDIVKTNSNIYLSHHTVTLIAAQ